MRLIKHAESGCCFFINDENKTFNDDFDDIYIDAEYSGKYLDYNNDGSIDTDGYYKYDEIYGMWIKQLWWETLEDEDKKFLKEYYL